eukprot:TRINITY_DN25083_c0_g1_i1.p1 TRINITY_DN25083_c0_g1~~TRINITY_DN25083_c0_g1_i1.p1  ORF type:complete len:402 (+),score=35.45 TRINITY_DN25083_c0_g1_i1:214-1419(+)
MGRCCHGCLTTGPKIDIEEKKLLSMITGPPVPASYTCGDYYVLLCAMLLIVPVMAIMVVSMALLVVPLSVVWLYRTCCLRAPLDIVPRNCVFYLVASLLFILSLPLLLVVLAWLLILLTVIVVLTLPVGVLNCSRTRESLGNISPFLGRPGRPGANDRNAADELAVKYGFLWKFTDVICAAIGQLDRQGFLELLLGLPLMISAIPVYKWLLMANPFTHRLQEVYINQVSDPVDADNNEKIDDKDQTISQENLRNVVCRCLLAGKNRHIIDAWPFSGYHQYPPPGRKTHTVTGMQFSNTLSAPALCHSTLPYDIAGHVPRSRDASWGLLIVYIQWWNPFYPYTGYVELNVRNDKALEHPMWLFNDKDSKLHMADLDGINRNFVKLGLIFIDYLRAQSAEVVV